MSGGLSGGVEKKPCAKKPPRKSWAEAQETKETNRAFLSHLFFFFFENLLRISIRKYAGQAEHRTTGARIFSAASLTLVAPGSTGKKLPDVAESQGSNSQNFLFVRRVRRWAAIFANMLIVIMGCCHCYLQIRKKYRRADTQPASLLS